MDSHHHQLHFDSNLMDLEANSNRSGLNSYGKKSFTEENKDSGWTSRSVIILLLLCAVSVVHPNLLNFPYFVGFLLLLMKLCFAHPHVLLCSSVFVQRLTRLIHLSRIVYVSMHLILLYSYQIPFLQSLIPRDFAKVVGLVRLFCFGCSSSNRIFQSDIYWTKYTSPVLLLLLFVALWWNPNQQTCRTPNTDDDETLEMDKFDANNDAGALVEGLKFVRDPLLDVGRTMTMKVDDREGENSTDSSEDEDVLPTVESKSTEPIVDVDTAHCLALLFCALYRLIGTIVLWPLRHKNFFVEHSYLLIPLSIMLLLLVHYVCCLGFIQFQAKPWDRIGFDNVVDAAAFHSLLIKCIFVVLLFDVYLSQRYSLPLAVRFRQLVQIGLSLPFFLTRFLDGRALASTVDPTTDESWMKLTTITHRLVDQPNHVALFVDDWAAPFVCLFSSILYVSFCYLTLLVLGDATTMNTDEWLSSETGTLASQLWLPTLFIFFLIVVHLKRFHVIGHANRRVKRLEVTSYRPTHTDWVELAFYLAKDRLELLLDTVVHEHLWKLVAFALTLLAAFDRYIFHLFSADLATWVGLRQDTPPSWPIILVLFLISLQAIVMHKCRTMGRRELFDDVSRRKADRNWGDGLRFFVKYFFHKFGLEVCLLTSMVLAATRRDFFGSLYMVAVALFRFTPRPVVASLWRPYGCILALLFVGQYLACIGLPSELLACYDYPWHWWSRNSKIWLFLPDPSHPPNSSLLIGDFLQLLFVWLQASMFARPRLHKGGDNTPVSELLRECRRNGHTVSLPADYADFISEDGSSMAYVKSGLFLYSHWMTLIVVLISGMDGGSIFAFGYLLAAFTLLWMGTDLYAIKSLDQFIHRWSYLVGYNLFILLVKAYYKAAVCHFAVVFPCWLRKLLSIGCAQELLANFHQSYTSFGSSPSNYSLPDPNVVPSELSCGPLIEASFGTSRIESTMIYDIFCFATLLVQMRIFNSWYFQHVVIDYRTDRLLGSRGAELTEDINLRESRRNEKRIRRDLEEIRNTFNLEDEQRPRKDEPEPSTHEELKRWGDYYMMGERFFPKHESCESPLESRQTSACLSLEKSTNLPLSSSRRTTTAQDDQNMVEKTQEVLGTVRTTLGHLLKLLQSPEWLYKNSKGHAFIAHVLEEEKRTLKRAFRQDLFRAENRDDLRTIRKDYQKDADQLRPLSKDCESGRGQRLWDQALNEWRHLHTFVKIIHASTYWMMCQSELLCFLLMIFVHMFNSALITVLLPVMVFFWGALCIPRPPKTFWIVSIVYLKLLIVLRLFFQHRLFDWTTVLRKWTIDSDNPFWFPRFLGIDPQPQTNYWDVALLSMLFVHRYKLFRLGLWSESWTQVGRKLRRRIDSAVVLRRKSTGLLPRQDDSFRTSVAFRSNLATSIELQEEGDSFEEQLLSDRRPPSMYGVAVVVADCSSSSSISERFRPWTEHSSVCFWFRKLLSVKSPTSYDWYAWMVACDAICLVLLTIFYSMLGQGGTGNVLTDVQASRLPRWFAYTLPAMFAMMIIDRWLYLSKKIRSRLLFYVTLVVLLHLIIFFILPNITGRSSTWNVVAMALYFVKSIYLLMCAWHIRHGYPSVTSKNVLDKNYGIMRLLILKLYLNVPFLFELRSAMDWTFTGTALTIGDWIRMENYYNEMIAQNCWIQFDHWFDNYFPTRRGEPTPTSGKFFKGVLSIMALILIILAPILVFAFLNSFGVRLPPTRMECSIGIDGYPPLYRMVAQFDELAHLDSEQHSHLLNMLSSSNARHPALSFLDDYSNRDAYRATFRPYSVTDWPVSLSGRLQMSTILNNVVFPVDLIVQTTLYRQREKQQLEEREHRWFRIIRLMTQFELRRRLSGMIVGRHENEDAYVDLEMPPYFLAPPEGPLIEAGLINVAVEEQFRSIKARFRLIDYTWRVEMAQNASGRSKYLLDAPPSEGIDGDPTRHHLQVVIFVDRVVPPWMSHVIGSGGMVAMYVAVVLVVGRFVRVLVKTEVSNSMVEDMPNADNVLRLIHDIYLLREKREFGLESRLFGKLLFLFRSSETLVAWSKYRVKRKID